jgi:hypothetical protein
MFSCFVLWLTFLNNLIHPLIQTSKAYFLKPYIGKRAMHPVLFLFVSATTDAAVQVLGYSCNSTISATMVLGGSMYSKYIFTAIKILPFQRNTSDDLHDTSASRSFLNFFKANQSFRQITCNMHLILYSLDIGRKSSYFQRVQHNNKTWQKISYNFRNPHTDEK